MKKKGIAALIMTVFVMICAVYFGTAKAKADNSDKVTIYVFNDAFKERVEQCMPNYSKTDETHGRIGNIPVEWVIVPIEDGAYQSALDAALSDTYSDVDVFLLESDYAQKYLYPEIVLPLSDLGISSQDTANQYEFTRQIGSYNGVQYASAWEADCGGMIYNRDIALEVLGTDDPVKVQAMVSDWDKFESVAAKMKAKGYKMTPCAETSYRVLYNNMTAPWVSNDKVNIDINTVKWAKMSKRMVKAGQTGTFGLWDTNADFKRNLSFCVFGPQWYMDYCMQYGSGSSIADRGGWALCEGPQAHYWGGTWVCVAAKSDNQDTAGTLVKMMTTNEMVLSNLAGEFGDCVNNKNLINSYAERSDKGNPVIGGQNPYTIYKDTLNHIDSSNRTLYDLTCNEYYQEAMREYFVGNAGYGKATDNFFSMITERYPNLARGTVAESAPVLKISMIDEGIKAAWSEVSGAAKYRVYRKTGSGEFVKIATTEGLMYVDSSAVYGKNYQYYVRACSADGSNVGEMSNQESIKYKRDALNITLSSKANGVKITWAAQNQAVKYRVYKKNAKGNFAKLDTVTELKYVDTTVVAGEKCTYAIVGLTSTGTEINEIGSGKTITYTIPAIEATLKYKSNGISVSWGKVKGAAKYRVLRKVGNGDWTTMITTTTLSYVDKSVVYGKTYTYIVRAMDASGSYISVKGNGESMIYEAPALKVTLSNTFAGVQIDWATISGAAKYRIFVKEGSSWVKLATVQQGTTYTDRKAKDGVTYYYSVVGMDPSGRLMNAYGDGKKIVRVKPSIPITLKSVASGVKISWDAFDGAGKYRVFRKNSDDTWTALATVKVADKVLYYKDTTVTSGKTYTYSVVPMSSGGSALADYGKGTSIKYVKPVSDAEILEAEVVDEDGNTVLRSVTEDEISEDFMEIIEEESKEAAEKTESAAEKTESVEEAEETTEETEAVEEDSEETLEETEAASDSEEVSEEAEAVEESEETAGETEAVEESAEETVEETEAVEEISEDITEETESVEESEGTVEETTEEAESEE